MRWSFSLAVLVVRGDRAKSAEVLVLRHENAVLRRNADRVRYDPADRAWFAALTRFIPRWRWAEVFPVTPATPVTGSMPAGPAASMNSGVNRCTLCVPRIPSTALTSRVALPAVRP